MKGIVPFSVTYIIFGVFIGIWLSQSDIPSESQLQPATTQQVIRQPRVVVLNAPTRKIGEFTRVGHLHSPNRILPLYGRQTYRGSSLWQYYTMSDGNIPVRLHFSKEGRDCGSEYGCKEIYDDDTIFIEEYGGSFRVNVDKPYLRYTDHVL